MRIDYNVFKAIYKPSIKKFIEDNNFDVNELANKFYLNCKDKNLLLDILNKIIERKLITDEKIDTFLLNELNYGRASNVYVGFIKDLNLYDKSEPTKMIKKLESKGFKNAIEVEEDIYIKDLRRFIEVGEQQLIYSKILRDNDNEPIKIQLLLAEGITISESGRSNNYYSIDIDFELGMVVIRIRNWGHEAKKFYLPDNKYTVLLDDVKTVFKLEIDVSIKKIQKLVYNMVNNLTNKVLSTTINYVDAKLKANINDQIVQWSKQILDADKQLEEAEKKVITQLILNNFYRVKMTNDIKKLTPKIIREKFSAEGYPRLVKFYDDTVGEGRARSKDPMESILDTSVFYDIKARMDKERNIKNAIIYWIDFSDEPHLGTSFHVDVQNRFKIVFYPNFFSEEMCNHVLRKIKKYFIRH